jgi:hypothetical protein
MRTESTSVRFDRMPANSARRKRRPWRTAIPCSSRNAHMAAHQTTLATLLGGAAAVCPIAVGRDRAGSHSAILQGQ